MRFQINKHLSYNLWTKYTRRLHLRSRFNLTTINPLETAGLGKIFHIFVASEGMLQMLPLILENSPFPHINAVFLNKIPSEIRTFSCFFNSFLTEVLSLQSKSEDWFLYDRDLRHERVKCMYSSCCLGSKTISLQTA